jgi:hypothetical protein
MKRASLMTQRPAAPGQEIAFPTPEPLRTSATEVRDWRCAKCDLTQPRPPETLLLGGYGRDHCSSCDKRTIWRSAELKRAIRGG